MWLSQTSKTDSLVILFMPKSRPEKNAWNLKIEYLVCGQET